MAADRTTFAVDASARKVWGVLTDVSPGRRLTWHGNAGADRLFAAERGRGG